MKPLSDVHVYPQSQFVPPKQPSSVRRLLAAAHVVANPNSGGPSAPTSIDTQATLAYRHHLWSWGLGVAEAMDTAQRGMGLSWAQARELIPLTIADARACSGDLVIGAQTDHLHPGDAQTLKDVEVAYLEQVGFIEEHGGAICLMASRDLARIATSADDYAQVYANVLSQTTQPVIIHWLGEMFDPHLAGYWGTTDTYTATETFLQIIRDNRANIDGIKLSLLDQEQELAIRPRLPNGVNLYTGDDFDYPHLIRGDGPHYSHALLGALDTIAPAAATALTALEQGDGDRFESILEPTLPLARTIFETPTFHYKVGITLVAYLNGHQSHFRMLGGLESARSANHLTRVYRHAGEAGLLDDPERAATRMTHILALGGCT